MGINYDQLWASIEEIIMLTCVNLIPLCPNLECSFDLLGFDVMIDQALKPWLIEVNMPPAIAIENNIDQKVKP